jgi:hypothetical protein
MPFRQNTTDEERRKFDAFTHAVTVISEPHRHIHDGFVYHCATKVTGLIDTGTLDHLIVVPAGSFPHFHKMRASVGNGDVDIVMYEGSTASADGTPLSSFNLNRSSSNTPDVVINTAPTITDVGTEIHPLWIPPTGAGIGQTVEGVSAATEGEEWVLAPSMKYLRRITNNSGATISLWLEYFWYEIAYEK